MHTAGLEVALLLACILLMAPCGGSAGAAAVANDAAAPERYDECADVDVSTTQLELGDQADIVVSGVTLAAGPGAGLCHSNGSLTPQPHTDPTSLPGTSFILVGLQCVHKGLVRCRSNEEDEGDCLVLIEVPVMRDAPPCGITQGTRYMFFLQAQATSCPGYYLAMYERAYHTIRRPLGGTGCSFYPCYPPADDLPYQVNGQCAQPVKCGVNRCDPKITRSPCANDTSVACDLKLCPGRFMYFNAIMPSETCYELYTYRTSGLPTNCYGRRYINNRIKELEAQQAFKYGNDTAAVRADGDAETDGGGVEERPSDSTVTAAQQSIASGGDAEGSGVDGSGSPAQQGAGTAEGGGGVRQGTSDPTPNGG